MYRRTTYPLLRTLLEYPTDNAPLPQISSAMIRDLIPSRDYDITVQCKPPRRKKVKRDQKWKDADIMELPPFSDVYDSHRNTTMVPVPYPHQTTTWLDFQKENYVDQVEEPSTTFVDDLDLIDCIQNWQSNDTNHLIPVNGNEPVTTLQMSPQLDYEYVEPYTPSSGTFSPDVCDVSSTSTGTSILESQLTGEAQDYHGITYVNEVPVNNQCWNENAYIEQYYQQYVQSVIHQETVNRYYQEISQYQQQISAAERNVLDQIEATVLPQHVREELSYFDD